MRPRLRHAVLASVVGVLLTAGIWWSMQPPLHPPSPPSDPASSPTPASTISTAADHGDTLELQGTAPSSTTLGLKTAEPTSSAPSSAGLESQWQRFSGFRMAEIQQQLMEDEVPFIDLAALDMLASRADGGDGEAAFLIYLRYLSCAQIPSEQASFDQIMNQYVQQRANNQPDDPVNDRMDTLMANLELSFEFCQEIEGDPQRMAYQWLRASADLNYLPAMIKFPIDAQSLFYPRLAFRQPELLVEFRSSALDYLNQALVSGHPSAFLQYAYLYQTDTLLEPDPQQIYAYAYAAKLAGFDPSLSAYVDQMMATAEIQLEIDEVSDAREMGRQLCERYCREGPVALIDP